MKVVITGAAGFIGSRVAEKLAENGISVLGVDSINDYYDPALKLARLRRGGFDIPGSCGGRMVPFEWERIESGRFENLSFVRLDVCDPRFESVATDFAPDVIIHLAAQPGVRYSISNPEDSLKSNVNSFIRVLEVCRTVNVRRLLYASSSSVYGNHPPQAFRETDIVDSPKSVYAVSKRTNEMLASVYADMYGIRMVGLRFFSVYGEWGRPDMAPYLFARAILRGEGITLFNGGQLSRDFTYIEDVVESVFRIVRLGGGMADIGRMHEVINIGHGVPTLLTDFVAEIEALTGLKANVRMLPMQPGEVRATLAETSKLAMQYGYHPSTTLKQGLKRFIEWLRQYEASQGLSDSGDAGVGPLARSGL